MSEKSSPPPPGKPADCPSDVWSSLHHVIFDGEESEYEDNVPGVQTKCQTENADSFLERNSVEKQTVDVILLPAGAEIPDENDLILEIIDVNDEGEVINNHNIITVHQPQDSTTVNAVVNEIVPSVKQGDGQKQTNEISMEIDLTGQNDTNKKNSRKRLRKEKLWKQNIRKTKRQSGKEYTDSKGKSRVARNMKPNTCGDRKCVYNCSTKITEDERKIIFTNFWALNDEKKKHYYSKHILKTAAVRKRTKNEISRKCFTYLYYLYVRGVKIRVCQDFFLSTLNISKNRIYYFFKKVQDPDSNIPRSPLTGKHQKKVISAKEKEEVRNHIASFPKVDSHYCRANTSKQYLERNLNIQRMYDLYKSATDMPVKYHVYRNIFNTEFNLGFLKPKKDLCDKCEAFKSNKKPTEVEVSAQEEHLKRKNIGNMERNRDRQAFVDDKSVGVISFDLENVFSLPKSNISSFFYKTKLCCYNLTAHLDKTNVVYCAIWHEMISGRKGNHIANALIKILQEVVKDNPKLQKIILWSDSCVPQNKNSIMSLALQYFLSSKHAGDLKEIEQKFGEPGHGNIQEVDSAHSCIERYIRNIDIWSPLSLIRILLQIPKTWKLTFRIIQMRQTDYLNFEVISGTINYAVIPYTKIKNIIYKKENIYNIHYRNAFEGNFEVIKLNLKKVNRASTVNFSFPSDIPFLKSVPQISDKKYQHLSEMLIQMPEADRAFYNVIFKTSENNKKKNTSIKNVSKQNKGGKKKQTEKKRTEGTGATIQKKNSRSKMNK